MSGAPYVPMFRLSPNCALLALNLTLARGKDPNESAVGLEVGGAPSPLFGVVAQTFPE